MKLLRIQDTLNRLVDVLSGRMLSTKPPEQQQWVILTVALGEDANSSSWTTQALFHIRCGSDRSGAVEL